MVAQDSPDRGGTTDRDSGDARPDYGRRLGEIESALASLAESQEDQSEITARGKALTAEREQILAEQRAEQRQKQAESSLIDVRHPATVATPEPGDAWAMVPKMTDAQLRQERMDKASRINSQRSEERCLFPSQRSGTAGL